MNIFALDENTKLCAQYHVDKHVVKMILESTQLLNNAFIKHDLSYQPVYRQTHKNHPASLWAAENMSNFDWLLNLSLDLCSEYTFRYHKRHKCQNILESFRDSSSRYKLPSGSLTTFRMCMPEAYHTVDPIKSYRIYYRQDKAYIAKWTNRLTPDWWEDQIYKVLT
jgi:hypothetical protein